MESGHRKLKADGFELVSVTDGIFEDNRISKLNRQILSAIAEYQREEIVFNLSVSRERRKQQNKKENYVTLDGKGKCEGRKAQKELQPALVKKLRRHWKTKRRMSLRQISQHLFELGYVNERGKPYKAQTIRGLIMKLCDKILYMTYGVGLVVLGMILNSLIGTDADAQNNNGVLTIRELRCKRLVVGDEDKQCILFNGQMLCNGVVSESFTIVDDKYNFRGVFGLSDAGDAFLQIFGEDNENPVAYLGGKADEDGEMIFFVTSKSKTDTREASMYISEFGGRFECENKMGEHVVRLGVGDDGGGTLDLRDKHGYEK